MVTINHAKSSPATGQASKGDLPAGGPDEPRNKGKRISKRLIRRTFPIIRDRLREYKGRLLILALLGLVLGVVPTLKSELEAALIDQLSSTLRTTGRSQPPISVDSVVREPISRFSRSSDSDGVPERISKFLFRDITLISCALSYFVLSATTFVLRIVSQSVQAFLSQQVFSRLRGEALRKGLKADSSDIPSIPNAPGQYAMAIQQGATNVAATYQYLFDFGQYFFQLVTTIVLVATKSWIFGLFCIAMVVAQTVISRTQAKRLSRRREELDLRRNELVARSDDILSKREIILAYEQQEAYGAKLDVITDAYAEIDRKLEVSEARYTQFSNLVRELGMILMLFGALAIALAFGRSAIESVGEVYFLISIYSRILGAASTVLTRYDSIKKSESTSKAFLEILELQPDLDPVAGEAPIATQWKTQQDIRFEEVSFHYEPGGRRVLNACSFSIPAAKTTLLLGPSGCGKTTAARILLRFWPASDGCVHIAGAELKNFSAHDLRLRMSYVAQGDHIIDDTVAENLAWGQSPDGITVDRMMRALTSVGIPDFAGGHSILDLPARQLSIGQQQRLSIARMMLDDSEIVIMDEPLAGVDVFTVRDLLPQVKKLLLERQHTVLVISHRLAFASYADHIVVMSESGEIVEEGSPADLLKRSEGVFSGLHKAALAELQIARFDE